MPFTYARDDARRRLRVTFTDPLTAAELIASVDRQESEGTWAYGLLVDSRAVSLSPSPTEVRSFLAHVRDLVATHGPRGPVAVVLRASGGVAGTHIYTALGGHQVDTALGVFWDVHEAAQWLDLRDVRSSVALS